MADAVQTTIGVNAAVGAPGMPYEAGGGNATDIITRIATEAIPFGSNVGIAGETCELNDTSAEVTGRQNGIALWDQNKPSGTGYVAGDPVRIMRKGKVWVTTEQQAVAGTSAFSRFATGAGGSAQGVFRNDADTATAVAVPSAQFFLAPSATLAVVEINQP